MRRRRNERCRRKDAEEREAAARRRETAENRRALVERESSREARQWEEKRETDRTGRAVGAVTTAVLALLGMWRKRRAGQREK